MKRIETPDELARYIEERNNPPNNSDPIAVERLALERERLALRREALELKKQQQRANARPPNQNADRLSKSDILLALLTVCPVLLSCIILLFVILTT